MLVKVENVNLSDFSIVKSKDSHFIRRGMTSPELQTEWMTLEPFCLPSRKYVTDSDKSLALMIPLTVDSQLFKFFDGLQQYIISKNLIENKTFNNFIKTKDGKHYLKLKLYANTQVFYGKDTVPEPISYITDFYKHLKADTRARFVLGFSKLWNMGNDYGFSVVVNRLQIDEDSNTSILNKLNFSDD